MKVYKNVRGSMKEVPNTEVNVDTVYVRSNVVRIEEEYFTGWQYDEIQYDKNTYIEMLSEKNNRLENIIISKADGEPTFTEKQTGSDLMELSVDHEYRLTLMELGV